MMTSDKNMPKLKLFHFPGACSRVSMTALEKIGCPYEDQIINLHEGEHKLPEYLALNHKGKVPALLIDGTLLTENPAILMWLHEQWPQAGLLPQSEDAVEIAGYRSDLMWFSSIWHPYVRAVRAPQRWTTGDEEAVRERGTELLLPLIRRMNDALLSASWFYGENWAIADVYLYWCYTTAEKGGFVLDDFQGIQRHRHDVEQHPALKAAFAREQASQVKAAKNNIR